MKNEFKNNIFLIYNNEKHYNKGYFLNLFDLKYNTSDWIIVIKNLNDFHLIKSEIYLLFNEKINLKLYSFVVVLLFKQKVDFLNSINYVPSITEAYDLIEIERIQRDLNIYKT